MKLSLVVPCYNEEDNVSAFFEAARKVFEKTWDYEIIFVNDGSSDHTFDHIKKLWLKNKKHVAIVNFSRNFGKEAAILAGLKHATGDFVTIIDADLQQRPELALEMGEFLCQHEEYDVVAMYQEKRIENKLIAKMKNIFYKVVNKVCDVEFFPGASDFRTFRKKVVDAILELPEYYRFSKGIFSWVGFSTYYIPYIPDERNAGSSKWTFRKLLKYAEEGMVSFTTFPLKIATYIGGITVLSALIYMFVVIIQKVCFSIDVPGYPTIVVLILLLGGVELCVLGIMGEYLARIYIQGKNRPIFIEKDFLSCDTTENNPKSRENRS